MYKILAFSPLQIGKKYIVLSFQKQVNLDIW